VADQDALVEVFTAQSNGLSVSWPADSSRSVDEPSHEHTRHPSRRIGLAAKAAVAASMTSVALAGITTPGLTATDPFGKTLSASIRDWQTEIVEEPAPAISWADVVAASTEEFLAIEAKRASLAERESALYDSYELDDEDWTA
jgi:hypothetical protein